MRLFIDENPVQQFTNKTKVSPEDLYRAIGNVDRQGFCMISDELDYGITSLAVPVIVPGRGIVGAVNSSAQTQRVNLDYFANDRRGVVTTAASDIARILTSAPDLLQILS